ncbi:pyrroloquinoline quinone biosynthesis peptide chaperone PqqD [Beggiatoa leptomitoformis]|uniref:PqqA binding protein n=1 Tax=Beggiatoa leptomitoformis TaxID=288004 RepID=A0A2N9YJ33_9GAMM|nr:pyrroloquinoline quinone biosynthesis peptide chaperone PqqD [Beggiatoa leptomitoformis]ALG67548.1 pyrroloquinoline quinone biosynthesis peptide chaperone PqqD [Beggiatoa leptomitoformis]AUI70226.1 pyrroloquinoline quinone biosynthesis peptide chaperone PqqD [Beggiatoa leptomitoformis]
MIENHHIINIAPLHRFQWEEAQQCFVILYPEGMVQLNPTAGEILRRCDGQRCVTDIVRDLQNTFPEGGNAIAADVSDFLEAAQEHGWISIK